MVNIVPLEAQHLNAVAQLHMMHLHTAYHGFVGRQLLVRYYAALSNTRAACGYTAIDGESVVGFVCGVWDTAGIRAVLLKRHLLGLLLWGTVQILSQPSTLGQWADRLKPTYIFENNREAISHYGYELRPIVVDPHYRGTGVAKQLVQQLIQDAAQRKFERLFLYADYNNVAANAFYRKVGFEHVSDHQVGTITYTRYEIATTEGKI